MTTNQQREEAVKSALRALKEFYDHVQILATTDDAGETGRNFAGFGNWYARQGMAHEFINIDIAQENAVRIANAINSDKEEE
jgi:hypothetical protein